MNKTILSLASIGTVAIAEAPAELPPWVGGSIAVALVMLIYFIVIKLIPEKDKLHGEHIERLEAAHAKQVETIANTYKESTRTVTSKLDDIGQKIDEGNQQQANLLRRAIWGKDGGKDGGT